MNSFSSDILYAVSKGKFLTFILVAMALGFYSAAGQKLLITLVHCVGYCAYDDQVNLIETAQAELVQHYQNKAITFFKAIFLLCNLNSPKSLNIYFEVS